MKVILFFISKTTPAEKEVTNIKMAIVTRGHNDGVLLVNGLMGKL